MSKFKVGDYIYWIDDEVLEETKTAKITKIEKGKYHYTFKNGTRWAHSIHLFDNYEGIRKLTKLERALR